MEHNKKISSLKNLGTFPDIILLVLIENLSVPDILNLRLTCSNIFNVSRCKDFYRRIQLRITKLSVGETFIFQKLFKEFGSYVKLITTDFEGDFEVLLNSIDNVHDISVSIHQLEEICLKCKLIKRLTINFQYCTSRQQLDNKGDWKDIAEWVKFIKKEEGKCVLVDFTCLVTLQSLREIVINGITINYEKYMLSKSVLYNIIMNTKTISKISFCSIHIAQTAGSGHLCEGCREAQQKYIIEADHIGEWCFNDVSVENEFFQFPRMVKSLEYRYVNCVTFKNLAIYKNITKLVLEGVEFDNTAFEFPNLKVLKICGSLRSICKWKEVSCPNLEELHLQNIFYLKNFQILFLSVLKKLILDSVYNVDDNILKEIMESCFLLTHLIFENVEDISRNLKISPAYLNFLLASRPELKIKICNMAVRLNYFYESLKLIGLTDC